MFYERQEGVERVVPPITLLNETEHFLIIPYRLMEINKTSHFVPFRPAEEKHQRTEQSQTKV